VQAYNYLYFLGTEEYLTDNHPPTASWCIKTRVIRVKLRSVVPHLPTPRQPPPKMDSSRPSDRTALPKKKPLRLQNIQQTRLRSRSLWPRTIQQRESSQVRGFIFCASRDEQTDLRIPRSGAPWRSTHTILSKIYLEMSSKGTT